MNITKRGSKYRVEVCIDYVRRSKTFDTKRDAVAWGNEMESKGILPSRTFGDAVRNYRPTAENFRNPQPRLSRLSMLEAHRIASVRLESLANTHLVEYREDRLQKVSAASVRVEMSLIMVILNLCREEWGWMHHTLSVKRPLSAPARRRGIAQTEIDQILGNLSKMRRGRIVSQMFLMSLETGMRQGELVGLEWKNVRKKTVLLRGTKNGDDREVPLSVKAREIIAERVGLDEEKVFPVSAHVVSKTFQRASVAGVHFHDARSEAITRLSKKLDVMALARVIGHRDLKSLMYYYAEKAEEMADRL